MKRLQPSLSTSNRFNLADFVVLTKFVLSFAVSLSGFFVYIIARGEIDIRAFLITLAILLIAMGVSVINQVQEFSNDAKMARTAHRPIASGKISPTAALLIGMGLIACSLALIYKLIGLVGVNLFIFALLWYNGVYTPLKKRTAFAVVPGAVLGIIPPAIAWYAGGEPFGVLEFFALALFYFIWQIPHFWLLVMIYNDDYDKAGYPTALRVFGKKTLQRLTFVWLLFTLYAGIFLVWVMQPYSKAVLFLLTGVGVWFGIATLTVLRRDFDLKRDAMRVFWHINLSFWAVSILLAIDSYLSRHAII